MWLRSLDAPHLLIPAPPCVAHTHTPLFNLCLPDCEPPIARPSRPIGPNNLPAPWRACSTPPSALLPPQRRQSCTSAPHLRSQRSTPLPPPRGRGGLAYPVRVFFNTTPECRDVRLPDERCRPVWTNRPPPSGEDWCVYPAGTVSSASWRVAHTHTHRDYHIARRRDFTRSIDASARSSTNRNIVTEGSRSL